MIAVLTGIYQELVDEAARKGTEAKAAWLERFRKRKKGCSHRATASTGGAIIQDCCHIQLRAFPLGSGVADRIRRRS